MTCPSAYRLKKGRTDDCQLLYSGAATFMVANATNSEFLQDATNLVTSGSTLELRNQHAEWKGVKAYMTTEGYLIMDRQIRGRVAYATLPPDASSDLQELQILNLQRRPVSCCLCGSAHKRDDSSEFLVYLKTGTTCDAYSQRGLFRVEVCS
jgi:hypothetical protein